MPPIGRSTRALPGQGTRRDPGRSPRARAISIAKVDTVPPLRPGRLRRVIARRPRHHRQDGLHVFDRRAHNIFSLKRAAARQPMISKARPWRAAGDSQRQMFPAFAKVSGHRASKVTGSISSRPAKIAAVAGSAWTRRRLPTPACRCSERRPARQRVMNARGPISLRHVLDVDHRQRQDHEKAPGGAEKRSSKPPTWAGRDVMGRSQGCDGTPSIRRCRGRVRGG